MPKKTKKEKIAAEYHRSTQKVIHTISSTQKIIPAEQEFVSHNSFQFLPKVGLTPFTKTQSDHIDDLLVIRHDMKKTLILATIAITFEFGLYFYMRDLG
ncbi:hypothetical protein HY409_03015 [Candidatus Gottesmanbacteria bacterium]|nr:hypothetical protein [Candidatus Gottesmanbacteria bacterium]